MAGRLTYVPHGSSSFSILGRRSGADAALLGQSLATQNGAWAETGNRH
jgi:hypothetical protein